MTLRAIIFDVDGTLAETEELHRRAFNETFAAAGLGWHWDRDDYRRLLKVTGGKERIAAFVSQTGLTPPDIPALHRDKTDRYTALMAAGEIALRDGIAALIDEARADGLRIAIATTTSRPNVDALIRATMKAEPDDIFDAIAAGDEVAAKKPAPDVYLLALHRLNLTAPEAVALEDSLNGVRSAHAAGLRCIVAPSAYTDDEDFAPPAIRITDFAAPGGLSGLRRLLDAPPAAPLAAPLASGTASL